MTPIEQVVTDYLKTVTAVSAIVSTRIFQLKVRQDTPFPSVRVQLISDDKDYHLRGEINLSLARVQIDSYGTVANTYPLVATLAEAINTAMSGIRFTLDNVRVVGAFRSLRIAIDEPGTQPLIRIQQDFRFRYQRVS